MYKSLQRVYAEMNRTPVPEPGFRSVYSEDIDVTMRYSSGKVDSFKLEDEYGRTVAKQLKSQSSSKIDESIDTIFVKSDWTGNQQGPKTNFKRLAIETPYEESLELVDYLAENKDKLLSRESLPIAKTFNFVELIKSRIPDEFITENLDSFIKSVHLNVVPKAATGVGLGEGTFTIFGTAQKGRSGDLQWDGAEVEIKTNGPNNGSGAILGGDGTLNKVIDRVEAKTDYEHINLSMLSDYKNKLHEIGSLYDSGSKDQAQMRFDEFRNDSAELRSFAMNPALNYALDKINDVGEFINTQLSAGTSFKILRSPKANPLPENLLLNRLIARIDQGIDRLNKQGTNLVGQMATFFGPESTLEDYITIFSEFKTYSDASDITNQVKEFFNAYDYTEFNPRVNYEKFQRLVGAISLVCYQEKIKFDFITSGNDDKMTMVVLDLRQPSIVSVYKQLEQVPEVSFSLAIDVYEGGSFKSQTVIAKSPRMKLS